MRIVSLVLILFTVQVNAVVPQAERDALVALYNSTDGDNWYDNTNWLVGDPCDSMWNGITCQADSVIYIRLDRENLTGSIPASIGNLTNLDRLNLRSNLLTGEIPSELGNLINLTRLDLWNNKLSGNIPPELGNMTSLRSMNLFTNNLTGTIPSEILNMTWLFSLGLFSNNLSGSIPVGLSKMTSLQSLTLGTNNFTGIIPEELGTLTNLTTLQLLRNQLTGTIPASLGNLINLTRLDLYENTLTGSIPIELANLINLEHLQLYDNKLSGTIPAELTSLINLKRLFLEKNQFSGSIPVEFGNFALLEHLNLSNNKLTGTIPTELGNILTLQTLRLDGNQLTGVVPDSLLNLVSLLIPDPDSGIFIEFDKSSLEFNFLTTQNPVLATYFDDRCLCDWFDTQTLPVENPIHIASSGDSVSINWQPVALQGDGGYEILMATIMDGAYSQVATIDSKYITVYTQGELLESQDYFFKIKSFTNTHTKNQNHLVSVGSEIISTMATVTTGFADLFTSINGSELLRATNNSLSNASEIGDPINYTITTGNHGPDDTNGAGFRHNFPTGLINNSWMCQTNTGATVCPMTNGNSNVDLSLNLPSGSSLLFTFNGEITSIDESSLLITSTITPSDGTSDSDLISNVQFVNFTDGIFNNSFE